MSRFLLVALVLVAGCKARDADTLRQIARKASEKADSASGQAQSMTSGVRNALGEGSVASRVETRLRWDRYLAGQSVVVKAKGEAVTLSGTVANESIRQRAVDLAKSTTGVENVTDEMEVK